MEFFLNVAGLFFMVSGMAAWGIGIILMWYYWLCQPKKGE